MQVIKMSQELIQQTIYALESMLYEINRRGSEPVMGCIASTSAALEIMQEAMNKETRSVLADGRFIGAA